MNDQRAAKWPARGTAAKPEGEIDFSDLPATQRKDWQGAQRCKFYRPIKQQLTVRVDADVLE
jgi:uncharacterized protein (DUF4415 family)